MPVLVALLLAAAMARAAELPPLVCTGQNPDWRLVLNDSEAELTFLRTSRMEIPHKTRAEGKDWPRAFTLIGARDTGIVLLHRRACKGAAYEAQLLTQRGETPILLTGCCTADE